VLERERQQEERGDEDWGRESESEEEDMGEEERKRVFGEGVGEDDWGAVGCSCTFMLRLNTFSVLTIYCSIESGDVGSGAE
jgi:hypothetical protein